MSRKERFSCRGLQVVESREDTLQTQLHNLKFVLKFIQSHKVAKLVARAGVAALFGLCLTGAAVGGHVEGSGKAPVARNSRTSSVPSCPRGEHTYTSTQGY